jgi:hypothetical protein
LDLPNAMGSAGGTSRHQHRQHDSKEQASDENRGRQVACRWGGHGEGRMSGEWVEPWVGRRQ